VGLKMATCEECPGINKLAEFQALDPDQKDNPSRPLHFPTETELAYLVSLEYSLKLGDKCILHSIREDTNQPPPAKRSKNNEADKNEKIGNYLDKKG